VSAGWEFLEGGVTSYADEQNCRPVPLVELEAGEVCEMSA